MPDANSNRVTSGGGGGLPPTAGNGQVPDGSDSLPLTAGNGQVPEYARDVDGNVVYPLDGEGNEKYWLLGPNDFVEGLENFRYARKTDGTEIYPQEEVEVLEDGKRKRGRVEKYLEGVGYAKTGGPDPKSYYPLGLDGHEYHFESPIPGDEPEDDPISNDGHYLDYLNVSRETNEGKQPEILVLPGLYYLKTSEESPRTSRTLQSHFDTPPPVTLDEDTDDSKKDGTVSGTDSDESDEDEKVLDTRPGIVVSKWFGFGYVWILFLVALVLSLIMVWKRKSKKFT